MCGRMTLTRRDHDELAEELDAELDGPITVVYRPRYNVAPTDPHPVVIARGERRVLGFAAWGFPGDGRPLINARAETVAVRPTFRDALRHRRCVVPADGFYEWRDTPDGRMPVWFHRSDGGLLLLAGLYEDRRREGGFARHFVVLTTPPNRLVAEVHDRMPAILDGEGAARWLASAAAGVLRPAPEGALVATPVSPRVNSVAHDDPQCLAPPAQCRQMSLF